MPFKTTSLRILHTHVDQRARRSSLIMYVYAMNTLVFIETCAFFREI